jgi:hypothetical protein
LFCDYLKRGANSKGRICPYNYSIDLRSEHASCYSFAFSRALVDHVPSNNKFVIPSLLMSQNNLISNLGTKVFVVYKGAINKYK